MRAPWPQGLRHDHAYGIVVGLLENRIADLARSRKVGRRVVITLAGPWFGGHLEARLVGPQTH